MYDARFVAAFWAKVDTSAGPDGCWYVGKQRYSYPLVWVRKKSYSAHKLAFELTFGMMLPGFVVMHRCDNPPCCNPAHLRPGTRSDNTQDMIRKGRLFGAHVKDGDPPKRLHKRSVTWPPKLYQQMVEQAERDECSVNALVVQAVREFIEAYEADHPGFWSDA